MQMSDDFARYLLFLVRVLSRARVELEAAASESEDDEEDLARFFGDFRPQGTMPAKLATKGRSTADPTHRPLVGT
jgi:hypothetical protein